MAERINTLVLEIETRATGDLKPSVQRLTELQNAAKSATGDTLKLVEAEKKLEQAAAQAGTSIDTETKKQTEFSKAVQGTAKAMKEIGQTNGLKQALTGVSTEAAKVNAELKKFEQAAKAAKSVDELNEAVNELMQALPEDIRADAFTMIQKEADKLEKSFSNPITRLRELKRLINTTEDPVLLKQYQAEAGKLQDQLGDTNELVRALASDTFFSDTLVEGAQQAVGAFSAFQGVLALTAENEEEFAKAAAKAQGALALLQGTQQILSNLKKEDNIITRTQILLQKGYALVVGQSTGAMKGFRLALAATGIGLAVIALGYLIANFDKVKYALGFGVNPETERYIELSRQAVEATENETKAFETKASALRAVADRIKEVNDDSLQGQLDRSNAEINIINRETEFIRAELTEREKLIEREKQKLNELSAARKEASGSSFRGPNLSSVLAPSSEDVKAQQKIIDDLEAAQAEGVVKTLENGNKIISIEKEKTTALKEEAKKQNDDRLKSLAEQERHALAIAGIEKKSEADILAIRIEFAQKRLELTKKVGTADRTDIERLKNEIIELRLELANLKPQDIEVFTPGSIKALEAQLAAINDLINSFGESEQTANLVRQRDDIEKDLQGLKDRIFGIQKELNFDLLDEAERHELAMQNIDESTNLTRINTQIRFANERLRILREAGKGEELEAIRLQNTITELEAEASKERISIRRKEIQDKIDTTAQAVKEATNLADTLLQIEVDRYNTAIQLQQDRVNKANEIAEKGNATMLEAEQDRLDKLTKEREKFVKRQQALSKLELIANTIVLVSKAAAQTGVAAAIGIAAALAALVAGLASGTATASSQSFKKGGMYESKGGFTGYGPPDGQSHVLGQKPYDYHFREYIMPDPVVRIGNNAKWFEKIRLERIDIGKMLSMKQPVMVNNNREVADAIKKIPGTSFQFNLNSTGIISILERSVNNEKRRNSKR